MFRHTVKYTDFNDKAREETFEFNLTKEEIMSMELGVDGGFSELLKRMSELQNIPKLLEYFKQFVLKAYGERSGDGRSFIKVRDGKKLAEDFVQTAAFSEMFIDLFSDSKKAAKFMNGLVPQDLRDEVIKAQMQDDNETAPDIDGASLISIGDRKG
jgi:hypothetical protein